MNIRNLIEIDLVEGGIKYYATEDREFPISSPIFYEGRLIDTGNINISLSDIYFGSRVIANATLSLDNTDGEIRDIWSANEMRGKTITIKRVDIDSDTVLETNYFIINKVELIGANEKVNIGVMPENLELFKQLIPKDKITESDFPNAHESALGMPIPIILGANHEKIPCHYINEDFSANEYDFLIGYGVISDLKAVYRYLGDREWELGNDSSGADFDFYDGSQSAPHAGYAFLRFTSEPYDANGTFHPIRCDCDGLENDESSSSSCISGALKQLKRLLTDSDFGLELTCNDTSFNTAQAILDGWGLTSRAYLGEQRSVSDWIDQFLMVARMAQLKKGSSGYEVEIESYNGSPVATFDEHNIKVISDSRRSYVEYISAVHFNYDRSEFYNKFNKMQIKYLGDTSIFTNDSSCVAVYRLEEDILIQDSRGSAHLTNINSVSEDAIDYKEGSCSASFVSASSQYLQCDDSNLSVDAPFKDGTTNRNMSICFWLLPSSSSLQVIISKFLAYHASFRIGKNSSNLLFATFYNINQQSNHTPDFGTALVVDGSHWYHIAITINGTTGAYRIRIWDDTANDYLYNSSADPDATGTLIAFGDPIDCDNAPLKIGTNYDGNIDEVVIFNDILTVSEIDDIRQNQFGLDSVVGIIKEYNSYFCPDDTTAIKVATFIRNKFKYQDRNIKGVAGQDAASLLNGNVISITNPALGLSSSLYQILNILKKANDYEVLAGAYSQDIFL